MLAETLEMSMEQSDCGTTHLVEYEIKNKKTLGKLNGKYFKMSYNDPDYSLLRSKKRSDLIGKKILVRSAATCALGENCVCPKCVGYTAILNMDIARGISGFESQEITKQLW